jgi:WD40 repeat protein
MAVAASRGGVPVWDLDAGRLVRTFCPDRHDAYAVAFSPDGSLLAVGGGFFSPGPLQVVDLARGWSARALVSAAECFSQVGFTPDGRHLLARSDWRVGCWEVSSGRLAANFKWARDDRWLGLLGDGRLAWRKEADGEVSVWPTEALCPRA